ISPENLWPIAEELVRRWAASEVVHQSSVFNFRDDSWPNMNRVEPLFGSNHFSSNRRKGISMVGRTAGAPFNQRGNARLSLAANRADTQPLHCRLEAS